MAMRQYEEWEPDYYQEEPPPPEAPPPPVELPYDGPVWSERDPEPPSPKAPPLSYTPPHEGNLSDIIGQLGGQATIAPGSSITPTQAQGYEAAAKAAGVPQDWMRDFLFRNPDDYHRLQSAYGSGGPGRTGGPTAPPPAPLSQLYGPAPQPKSRWQPQEQGPVFGPTGGPGVFAGPLQQVGQDPLSQIITGALGDLIKRGGISPTGADVQATLQGIIGRGGRMPEPEQKGDRTRTSLRKETAREQLETARRTQSEQLSSRLASRGLMGEPGQPSGAELSSIGRMEERIQAPYADALRGILGEESQADEGRLQQALQLTTGLDVAQSRFLLDSIQAAGGRQEMLSNIALQSLDRNMAWNMFLAKLGMERSQVMEEMQSGRIEDLMPLIQMFLQTGGMSAGGFV